jgi:hypothetical protein
LSEMSDILLPSDINVAKETYAVVFRPHPKWQYSLEMIRLVDDQVWFLNGVATVQHKFKHKPSVQVFDGDNFLPVESVDFQNWQIEIVLEDVSVNWQLTVILS